ncbi:MAG: hypothetical protein Q7S68_04440, partial [Deltaproteobacteria bacterium]|nr:hypothetical protein [Deltaproteobacteria bacterium]
MKKIVISLFAVILSVGTVSFAQEAYVAGGFEASGHIVTGSGYQRYSTKNNAASAYAGAAEVKGTIPGVLGGYQNGTSVRPTAENDQFMFFVDEVELDLAKSFSENTRVRADLDFGSTALNSGRRFEPVRTNPGLADGVGVD